MNQSNLTPQQQALAFLLARQNGSQPTSGGLATDTPDQAAQNGVGQMDAGTLQQLFGQAPGANIQPQEGDKMHLMDAIQHIGQQMMGPTAPEGVSKTGGPQLQMKNGQLTVPEVGHSPAAQLLGLFGVKQNTPVDSPNYFDTAKKAGLLDYLPNGLAQMPDGTPFVGKTALDQADTAKKGNSGIKQSYNNEQLKVLLNPASTADDYSKAFNGQTPQEVISDRLRSQGLNDLQGRHNEGQWNKFTQAVVPALVRGNTAAGIEARKLFSANHALSLFDQAKNQPDGADPRQQVEAAMNTASLLMTNGVVTQAEVEKLLPNTWRNKAATWQEFLLNDPTGTHSQEFMDRLEGTVNRQIGVSTENLKRAVAPLTFGYQHLSKQDPERFQNEIMAAVNNGFTIDAQGRAVPTIVDPNGGQVPVAPPSANPVSAPAPVQPHYQNPDDVKAAYQSGKINLEQAKALTKAFHKGGR